MERSKKRPVVVWVSGDFERIITKEARDLGLTKGQYLEKWWATSQGVTSRNMLSLKKKVNKTNSEGSN